MNIIHVFRDNLAPCGFERTSEDALGWLYASRLIFDTPEGSA